MNETDHIAQLINQERKKDWVGVLRKLKRDEFIAIGNLLRDDVVIRNPLKVSAVIPEEKKEKYYEILCGK